MSVFNFIKNKMFPYCFNTLMLNIIICKTAWYILNKEVHTESNNLHNY